MHVRIVDGRWYWHGQAGAAPGQDWSLGYCIGYTIIPSCVPITLGSYQACLYVQFCTQTLQALFCCGALECVFSLLKYGASSFCCTAKLGVPDCCGTDHRCCCLYCRVIICTHSVYVTHSYYYVHSKVYSACTTADSYVWFVYVLLILLPHLGYTKHKSNA